MASTVFIDGDQGTTGLRIHEQLAARDDLRLASLPPGRRKDPRWRAEAINSCDIAILCLPDAAAGEAAASVTNPSVRIIDASSAHRTAAGWVYGFPEMSAGQAQRIASARRVSNPGCYPTGAIALLRPLVQAGMLPADYPLVINAVSGYSGRGRAAVEQYEGAGHDATVATTSAGTGISAASAFQLYGLRLEHKHVPEIERHAGLASRPIFVPSYGAFRQGIALTIGVHARLLPAGTDAEQLHDCLAAHYAGEKYVRLTSLGSQQQYLDPQALNDTNMLQLSVFANPGQGQVLLAAVFDNLGKGASGAAIQNLELMLGAS